MSAIDFFAGCLGGAAGVLIGHPLDTVKVKLQTQGMTSNSHGVSPPRIRYRGTFHCLISTYQNEKVSNSVSKNFPRLTNLIFDSSKAYIVVCQVLFVASHS